MATYKFVKTFEEEVDPNAFITLYFQVATFQNPKNMTYHVRRFMINDKNEFKSVKDYYLTKKQYERFLQKRKPNEYKIYSVYDLDMIKRPTLADILTTKSSMLSTDVNYYGAAPF